MIKNDYISQNKQAKKLSENSGAISHFVQISLMSGLIKKAAVSHTYFCIQSVTIAHQTASRKLHSTLMRE